MINNDFSHIQLKKPLSDNLFSDIAKKEAARVFEAGGGSKGNKNKSTQLRKFYDELCMWNEKKNPLKENLPFIRMLHAKVAYARGRDHVDIYFEQMFSHVINQITVDAPETLKHAKLFIEAFMGFYKAQEK